MKTFVVTILRTERIAFAVDAENHEEAEDQMYGGDEIASETVETVVESVVEDDNA